MRPGEGWSAILVIRAWAEGDSLGDFRARVIGTADVSRSESTEAAFRNPEELSIDLLPYWYEDWVLVERERFRQLRLHALEALCEQLTALGRFDHAVEAGIAAVAGRAAARERAPGPDPGAPDGGELRGGRAAVPVLS